MGRAQPSQATTTTTGGVDPKVWLVVSKVAAALFGGFALTYWAGSAFAKATVVFGILDPVNAGLGSGWLQILVYAFFAMWVSVEPSIRRTWIVWAVLTGLCFGLAQLPPPAPAANAGQAGAPSATTTTTR